jgi:hypothetical protein
MGWQVTRHSAEGTASPLDRRDRRRSYAIAARILQDGSCGAVAWIPPPNPATIGVPMPRNFPQGLFFMLGLLLAFYVLLPFLGVKV